MIYCFLWQVSCIILFLACSSMLVHMLFILIYVLYALCHVFVPRSIFPMCYLARSACFHACLHVYLFSLHILCFMPFFPILCSFFCSMLMLGLHAHMLVWCFWLCLAWIYVFMPIFPCHMVRSLSSHACTLGFVFFHAFTLTFTCLRICFLAYMFQMFYATFPVLVRSMPCLCA